SCYYYNESDGCATRLQDFDRDTHKPGDESQSEGDISLALRRALSGSLEGEPVGHNRIVGLWHGAEVLRAPNPLVVRFTVKAGQNPAGTRDLAHDAEARHQLEPVHGERHVRHMPLGIRAQWI